MINAIIRFAVKQRLLVMLTVAIMIGAGVYSFQHLPIDAVPDVTNVQVMVLTSAPALAPLEVERQITFPVEVAMSGLPGITEIRSPPRSARSQESRDSSTATCRGALQAIARGCRASRFDVCGLRDSERRPWTWIGFSVMPGRPLIATSTRKSNLSFHFEWRERRCRSEDHYLHIGDIRNSIDRQVLEAVDAAPIMIATVSMTRRRCFTAKRMIALIISLRPPQAGSSSTELLE